MLPSIILKDIDLATNIYIGYLYRRVLSTGVGSRVDANVKPSLNPPKKIQHTNNNISTKITKK